MLGRRRAGDIPGREIPAGYKAFLRDGDPRPLLKILAHNTQDLHSMAELAVKILATEPACCWRRDLPGRSHRKSRVLVPTQICISELISPAALSKSLNSC